MTRLWEPDGPEWKECPECDDGLTDDGADCEWCDGRGFFWDDDQ